MIQTKTRHVSLPKDLLLKRAEERRLLVAARGSLNGGEVEEGEDDAHVDNEDAKVDDARLKRKN